MVNAGRLVQKALHAKSVVAHGCDTDSGVANQCRWTFEYNATTLPRIQQRWQQKILIRLNLYQSSIQQKNPRVIRILFVSR